MRRLAATLVTTALLLTACGSTDEPAETPGPAETAGADGAEQSAGSEEDLEILRAVQVEGDFGSEPTLTFDQPFEIAAPAAHVVAEGDGEPLEEGQIMVVDVLALSGDAGETLQSTYADGTPERLPFGDPGFPQLNAALTGQNVGTRLLYAVPGGPAQEEGGEDVPATLLSIDVVDVLPTRAEGTPVEPTQEGLPTVTLAEDGAPTIDVEGATEPTELVVQTLIEGEGPVVESGQTITVQYHGALLSDGTVFDSSWERGQPAQFGIGVGQVIPGWDQGLVGQKVGSQVLLVIPSELAYGDQERDPIPANSDLVFVVDILDAS
ncbi:FKBP-type peptidyl-prolyl cis-trans isomerase [Actinotalea sp. Marseille-Q4924]|uniref:FKBP-type peptidyl-prolyl cis-trans isomerase n=1 Tax=Actinotalea sp. Marseille-Q4924 TaxID=2866571 RepID=UPI001CE4125D|nr:FKBP-type peptidyl-prolyl cis-trans isomerase [Actinotalea sp. Marseille-Q4924]